MRDRARMLGRAVLLGLALLLPACAPLIAERGTIPSVPTIEGDRFLTRDGLRLGLTEWYAADERYVLVAFHGMNDYANAYSLPAPWWAERGVTTYAVDQRGFGRSPNTGIWAGADALTEDAADLIAAVRARHPDRLLFILGESMGGAVVLATLKRHPEIRPDGVILVAPAVWGWSTMNFAYRAVLWITAHTIRAKTVTGSGLTIWPSDNMDVLKELGADPLVIKPTRTDAIYGLVDLMDEALLGAHALNQNIIILYGDKDEIVPRWPIEQLILKLGETPRTAFYPKGYHLLLRDLQREVVWKDVLAFIEKAPAPLPSGHETTPPKPGS